ncbi:MAG: Crp/Fnr family transcriptional regulator [bacterium]
MNPRPRSRPGESTLLEILGCEARDRILRQCNARRYDKGEQIVREMARDHNLYFITRGRVRVNLFSRDGREVNFAHLGQGDHFGEISMIDGKPRSANVVALTEAEITIMPPRVFDRMLSAHPAVARALLVQLTEMIRRLCDRIFEYSTVGVNNRIHAELLRLAKDNLDLDGIARIADAPTHAQLASRVSCHREAVSREMKSLQNQGILARESRKLIVREIDQLQALVSHASGR